MKLGQEYDELELVLDIVEMVIQINGKIKDKIDVPSNCTEKEIEEIVIKDEKIKALTCDKEIKKIIVIKGRLINIVVK